MIGLESLTGLAAWNLALWDTRNVFAYACNASLCWVGYKGSMMGRGIERTNTDSIIVLCYPSSALFDRPTTTILFRELLEELRGESLRHR